MITALFLLLLVQVTPELKQHVDAGLKAKSVGDFDTAVREFRRVAELAPDLPAAHVNLGAVLLEKKDYTSAAAALRRALELNPDLPGAHGMLGSSLLSQGFAAEAIPHLEKGQVEDLLGVALLEAGRTREAVDLLESALSKRPDDPDLLYYLGQAHGRLARQVLDRLRASSPESARTHQILGEAMAASGNREAAEKHLRSALSARPEMRGVHHALGELFLESGDYEKAEAEFRAEARRAPGAAVTAYKLAVVLMNGGRAAEALMELRRANTLQPGMPEVLLELGKAQAATGSTADAENSLRQALKAEPKGRIAEAAHFQLAQLYRKLGRVADAKRETALFEDLRKQRTAPRP